jgi:hypothetical protein
MSPVDFAKTEKGNNLMVRMLSGASTDDTLTGWHVNKALENLKDHFLFVGRTERYADIFRKVRELGWPVHQEPRENEGKTGTTTLDELIEVRRLPELALDYDLYRRLVYVKGS